MLRFIAQLWCLWVLAILVFLCRLFMPKIKGWLGEKEISAHLHDLPQEDYTVLNNLIFQTGSGTTQIDHVVVSVYGIFVIETKNYAGWIFGSEQSAQWTQNIYGKKNWFMNPIHQNYAHVKALESLLAQYPSVPIIPIVAFSAQCDLKVRTTSHVVYFHHVDGVIRGYTEKVLKKSDAEVIANLLREKNINSSSVKKAHIESVVNEKFEMQNAAAGDKCPKCSGVLVERNGRYGSFIGCSNYPKCKFTKQI